MRWLRHARAMRWHSCNSRGRSWRKAGSLQQPAFLGAAYNIRLESAGIETVKKLGKPVDADKIRVTIKGPASNYTIDVFFAKDEARTPVLARIPLRLARSA